VHARVNNEIHYGVGQRRVAVGDGPAKEILQSQLDCACINAPRTKMVRKISGSAAAPRQIYKIRPITMYFIRNTATKVTFSSDILDIRMHPMNQIIASFLTLGLLGKTWSGLSLALARLFQEGESVPGTTDSIMLMGILIVLTIVIPIVWTRRKWMR
jgi:hypothetical protein